MFVGAGQPLECREVDVPGPGPGEAVVRTVLAGVCGTDVHRLKGDLPLPPTPVAFGHEGVGRVHSLGPGLVSDRAGSPVAEDDLVYWGPLGDRPLSAPTTGWPPPADLPSPAAYQDYATLPAGNLFYRIPDGTSPDAVIAFGCAMPTALGAISRVGGISPGQTVVIQGAGPVGLASTVLCSLRTARRVIVIDGSPARLAAAIRLGADHTMDLRSTTVEGRKAEVLGLTGGRGADVVIEATGRLEAFTEGTELLAYGGRYAIVGIYSGKGHVRLDPVALNNRNQAVIGSLGPAGLDDYGTTVEMARRHGHTLGFGDLITDRFPLSRTSDAIERVRSGRAIKAVVMPELDEPLGSGL